MSALPPSEMITATRVYLNEHNMTLTARFQFRMSDVQFVEEVNRNDDPFADSEKGKHKVIVTMVSGQRFFFMGKFETWAQRNIELELTQRFAASISDN